MNNKIIKVEMFQTSDGQVHHSEREAEVHEIFLSFMSWYREHPMIDNNYGGTPMIHLGKEVFSWLLRNRTEILKVMTDEIWS